MPLYKSNLQTISYTEFTANVTVSGTSGAPTTVVSAPAFTADGTSSYWVEFFSPDVSCASTTDFIIVELFDSTTDLGMLAQIGGINNGVSVLVKRRVTPTAASHSYIIKAYRVTANGTIVAGTGGALTALPGYVLITKAI